MYEKVYELTPKKSEKLFKKYDVKKFDELYLSGYHFPVPLVSKKIEVKDNREIKSPITHDHMIGTLKKAGVSFTDKEKEDLLSMLPTINYYRLSVFTHYLSEDKSFSHLCQLYQFDRFLSESINKLLSPIEVSIKTSFAYNLSTRKEKPNGALVYLDETLYKDKHVKNDDVAKMKSIFVKFLIEKQDKDPSIKHHMEYYGGNIPIWVLMEQLTMGNIATLVTYIDRPYRKYWVRNYLPNVNDSWIIEWVKTIQFLRNTTAHFSRVYGKRFNYSPNFHDDEFNKLPDIYRMENKNGKGYTKDSVDKMDKLRHTLFSGLVIMKRFYQILPCEEQERWSVFLRKLEERIIKYKADLYRIGFPENWLEILTIKIDKKEMTTN